VSGTRSVALPRSTTPRTTKLWDFKLSHYGGLLCIMLELILQKKNTMFVF
jgi:hypothetical protein